MTSPTTFSIVIPTYNRSSLVVHAVQSVLRENWDGVQVIVSDNHSTDATQEVLRAIDDPRVQLVRPPEHVPLPVHWEWARQFATNDMMLLLSDDDALVPGTLKRVDAVAQEYPMTTIVGRLGEYFSTSFPGERQNVLLLWACRGGATLYPARHFLGGLYDFQPPFDTHPTGWFFHRAVIEKAASRCGYFFKTNGAEYHAIPAALAVDPKYVQLDEHIGVVGRMPESIGTKIVFTNPGKEALDEYVADMEKRVGLSPISVQCFGNLMSEGLWSAKQSFELELGAYPKNLDAYLTYVGKEFARRRSLGISYGFAERQLEQLVASHDVSWRTGTHPLERIRVALRTRLFPARYGIRGGDACFSNALEASTHAVNARPIVQRNPV